MLKALRRKIDLSMASFLTAVEKNYRLRRVDPILYNSIRELCLREGKRIRPLLLILAYQGYLPASKRTPPSLYHASTCIEFLHVFMLIHDDIIDRSDLRRGKPAMHRMLQATVPSSDPARLGSDLAIIAGDIVYALAIDAFLAIQEDPARKERALKYFIQTAAFTAMGEFIDTVSGVDKLANISEKDVFLNYSLKTARYTFDCPLVTGAILAGAPKRETDLLAEFGLLIGQAFQIQDDIIGTFQTEKTIGKSILSDLEEQKKTILTVHAYRTLKGKKLAAFLKIFHRQQKTLADLEKVRRVLVEAGSLAYALNAMRARIIKASLILGRLAIRDRYRDLIKDSLFTLFKPSDDVTHAWRIRRQS